MRITTRKRRSTRDRLLFDIQGVNREDLSLLLSFAEDGIITYIDKAADPNKARDNYGLLLKQIKEIDNYINNEDNCVRMSPLELD